MKNRSTDCAALLAAALAITPVFAQNDMRQALVIRHDPAILRLHEDLLETLLTDELLSEVQARVWGKDCPDELQVEADIRALNVTQGATDWFEQPDGVFAAVLRVKFKGSPTEKRGEIVDGVVAGLEKALTTHLALAPREWLARQRDAVFADVIETTKGLTDARAQLAALPVTNPEDLARRRSSLVQARVELQLDVRTEQAALQLLEKRMSAARGQPDGQRAGRSERRQGLHGRILAVRARLEEADPTTDLVELAETLKQLSRELQQQTEGVRTTPQPRPPADSDRPQRIKDLGAQIEQSGLTLHRLESRLEGVEQQIQRIEKSLASVQATAGTRADLEFRIRLLEKEVEHLRQRATEFTERMGSLGSVQVELWRPRRPR